MTPTPGSVRRVSTLGIRGQLRRRRRRLKVVAAVLALACVIAIHHNAMAMDGGHDVGMGAAIEMCLGVFTAVGAAVAAAGLAILALGPPRALATAPGELALPWRPSPTARARHGPELLSLLCVSRR